MNKEKLANTIRQNALEFCESYPTSQAIRVYGGIYHFADQIADCDFECLLSLIANAIQSNRFCRMEESDEAVVERYCHMCYVDPQLVRVYANAYGVEL